MASPTDRREDDRAEPYPGSDYFPGRRINDLHGWALVTEWRITHQENIIDSERSTLSRSLSEIRQDIGGISRELQLHKEDCQNERRKNDSKFATFAGGLSVLLFLLQVFIIPYFMNRGH